MPGCQLHSTLIGSNYTDVTAHCQVDLRLNSDCILPQGTRVCILFANRDDSVCLLFIIIILIFIVGPPGLSQLERERLERLGIPPTGPGAPPPGPGGPSQAHPHPSSVAALEAERLALATDPMVRLQMAGERPFQMTINYLKFFEVNGIKIFQGYHQSIMPTRTPILTLTLTLIFTFIPVNRRKRNRKPPQQQPDSHCQVPIKNFTGS